MTGYEGEAGLALARRYEAVSAPDLHGPVADLLPSAPSRVLDVGAGSGRDAAWLAKTGHAVLAVEPSATLRAEGARRHPDPRITWVDDRLPDLTRVGGRFGVILLSAVWQHVAPPDRPVAFRALTGLLAPGGLLLISLRLGPPDLARGMHPVSVGGASCACGRVRPRDPPGGAAAGQAGPVRDQLGHRRAPGSDMSLADVYLQHRVHLLERQVSILFETTRVLNPEAGAELTRLERAWRAELDQLHAAFLRGDLAHFERREARVRGGG